MSGSEHLSERSYLKMVVLFVITFGLYGIYWMHVTSKGLQKEFDLDYDPTVRTIMFFIPLVNIYATYKFCEAAQGVVDTDTVLLFVVWIVFAPLAVYLMQDGVNEYVSGG